ncbi:hypothetical protein QGN23_03735 [Chryseobacterium gotjawalense]|uniref:Uncharacterized protein n=1 Tax=Chryseobacterium gotjawalense TaxID=3042315 RepID=A0ABY8REK0_9FLAO|nr:hypothetical protein [Chryseobacterium sp. wdc7]WHF52397.1 hypothetical protein QGN23_03735 [Chryseobacterium sp. wdc7]
MEITTANYFEPIEKIKSGNILKYKNLKFLVTKTDAHTNFKLKPNMFAYIITLVALLIVTLLFVSIFLLADNEQLVGLGMLPSLAVMYFSKKIAMFVTEKLYKNEISDFFQILKLYNQEKIKSK